MARIGAGPAVWMPWAMVIVFAGVSAVTAATTSLLLGGGSSAPEMAADDDSAELRRLDRSVANLQDMVQQLSNEMHFLADSGAERREMPPVDRVARGDEPTAEGEGEPESADGARRRSSRENPFGELGSMFEGIRKLRSGTDEERLAAAREILAGEENGMGQLMAIDVLIELSPEEGLTALREYAADPEAGGGRGRDSFERSLAKLAKVEGIDFNAEMVAMFDGGNESVQRAAARALADAGDDRLVRDLLAGASQGLYATEMSDRLKAIDEVSRLGTDAASGYLLPLLSDSSVEVRLKALDALRRTGDDSSIAALESLLNDPVERVREKAEDAIQSIRNPRSRDRGGRGSGNFFGGTERGDRGDRGARGGRGGRGG